jgi:hypothetical protein
MKTVRHRGASITSPSVRREAGRVARAVLWAVVCLAAAAGRGEDDRVVESLVPDGQQLQLERQANSIDLAANFDASILRNNGLVINGMVFGPMNRRGRTVVSPTGGDDDQNPESPLLGQARLAAGKRLARVDELCDLTDEQRRKLQLAMESDIRGVVGEVEAERLKYAGKRVQLNDIEGQRGWQQFQHDLQRCRKLMLGLFGTDSLFAKALPTVLDDAQYSRLTSENRARRSFAWRSMVTSVLVRLDDGLGLNDVQHRAIERALLAHEPPLRIDQSGGLASGNNQHLRQMLVYMVLSEVDTRALRPKLSDRQWNTLAMLMNQGKAMRSWIEQQGVFETRGP